ncbi:PAS domain-containing protein [Pseudozobellia sp. WGM2]|uniref:PAS domain-containing protein n=1 Tax=Pseudozobellia sp. WGM2 TaxID=2787625 RepID=UPI001ADF2362|nr:PAS domain-containing protein [Pseudozobellia sp. WGM2]
MDTSNFKEKDLLELLSTVVGISKIGVYKIDVKSNEVYWNDVLRQILEVPDDFQPDIENSFHFVENDFIRQKIYNIYEKICKTAKPYELDYEAVTAKGKKVFVWSFCKPIVENGEVTSIIGGLIDITHRKKTENDLHQFKEKWDLAEGMIKIGYWQWNVVQNQFICSDNLRSIYQIDIGIPIDFELILSIVHPDDQEMMSSKTKHFLKTKSFEKFTYRIKPQDGKLKFLQANGIVRCNEQGEVIEIVGTTQDITETISREQELKQKNAFLNFAGELSNLGYWTINLEDDKIEWSDTMYRLYDIEEGTKLSYENFLDIIISEDRQLVIDKAKETFKTGKKQQFTHRSVHQDGSIHHLRAIAEAVVDQEGRTIKLMGSTQDITNDILSANDLEQKNEQLSFAEQLANFGFFQWNVVTGEASWSDNTYRVYGVDLGEEVNFQKFIEQVHEDDVEAVKSQLDDIVKSGTFTKIVHRTVPIEGTVKTVEILGKVLKDNEGHTLELKGSINDITVKAAKEKELIDKNQQLNTAEKMAKIGNWKWKLKTNELIWSDHLYEMYGHDKNEALSFKKYLSYVHKEDRPRIRLKIEQAIENKAFNEIVYRAQLKDGSIKTIKSIGSVLTDKEGQTVEMLGTCQDISDQVAKEQELIQKNQMMTFAEELSGIGYWKWDITLDTMEYSDNLLRILDFEPETSLTFPLYQTRVHPKDSAIVKSKLYDFLKKKQFDKFEHRILRRDGTVRTLEILGEVLLDDSGTVTALMGSTKDITENIRQQQDILQQNQLLNLAEELSGIGHWKWSQLRENFELSDNFYRILDLELGKELTYDGFMQCVHPEDRESITKTIYNILQTKKFKKFSHRIIRKDGTIKILEVVGDLITDKNDMVEIVGSAQDVTDRRMAETKFRGLLESAPDAMVITDRTGNIQIINKQTEILLGYGSDELIGKHITTIYPKNFWGLYDMYAKEFLKNTSKVTKIQNQELYVFTKNGEKVPIILSFGPVETSEGILISIAIKDITQRKNAEDRILETNKKLRENSRKLKIQNKQLSDFNHITSHNLRAPVSNLDALLDLYHKENDNDKKALLFQKFEKVIEHLSSTLDTLVETLRIKSETAKNKKSIPFEDILEKTKEILAAEILNTGSTIISDFGQAPEIVYNNVYLESIFLNLISNAIKYRAKDRSPVINIKTWQEEGKTNLRVRDNGLGIDLKRYGKKMFGLNKVFHRHPQAKGVGLFLTKAQIEAMGGSISVESEVNRGTTFNIVLD